jgi:cell division septation protein DedD
MNIIQKLRNLIFGESKVVKAPTPVVVETPTPVVVEPTVQELVATQEAPAPKTKPKRKYYKKKKSTGESK